MSSPTLTCPGCGALITPQLARCRRCKKYLHGTRLEGFLFEHLLPESLRAAPGTGLISLLILFYYLVMILIAGIPSMASFSRYSLIQTGALHGSSIALGQYWRVLTSVFAHHDLMHLAFNLWALAAVGPIIEELFDKKKLLFCFLFTGIGAMSLSHIWFTSVRGDLVYVSAGASGAISGLIGAALWGARRAGPAYQHIFSGMVRWSVYTLLFGLVAPVNNSAHIAGFGLGIGFAALCPLGATQRVLSQRLLAGIVACGFLATAVAFVLMLSNARGFPGRLEADAESTRLFMFTITKGHKREYSTQVLASQACLAHAQAGQHDDAALQKCEFAVRAHSAFSGNYWALAQILVARGQTERAAKLSAVAEKMQR